MPDIMPEKWVQILIIATLVISQQKNYVKNGKEAIRKHKENCTWIPLADQAFNKSSTTKITLNGETKSIAAWSLILFGSKGVIHNRIWIGWSLDRAINTPRKRSKNKTNNLLNNPV